MRRLVMPVVFLAVGVVSILVFAATQLTDQWLQSGDPVVSGRMNDVLDFDAENKRYTIRMGRRGKITKGNDPTIRVSYAVARSAICLVTKASGKQAVLQRTSLDEEGGITPLVGTFAGVPGRTTVECRWEKGQAWRGDVPMFVATERTFLRKFGYAALIAGLLWLALGGLRLWRGLR